MAVFISLCLLKVTFVVEGAVICLNCLRTPETLPSTNSQAGFTHGKGASVSGLHTSSVPFLGTLPQHPNSEGYRSSSASKLCLLWVYIWVPTILTSSVLYALGNAAGTLLRISDSVTSSYFFFRLPAWPVCPPSPHFYPKWSALPHDLRKQKESARNGLIFSPLNLTTHLNVCSHLQPSLMLGRTKQCPSFELFLGSLVFTLPTSVRLCVFLSPA